MVKEKTKVNIIYKPQQTDAKEPRFSNELGEVWMNGSFKPEMHNVGMSFYSCCTSFPELISDNMSIYVIEPACVAGQQDYNIKFLKNFNYIFTWADKSFKDTEIENKVISLNHPSCYGVDEKSFERFKQNWLPWDKRSDEIVFIANNKKSIHDSELYSVRIMLADYFHANTKFKISWYGQIPINREYYKGKLDDKINLLSKVKYSICTENSYHEIYSHNYFSEKMPEVWFGGAVPLYIGCYNIDDFNFNKNSYIDLRKYINKNKRKSKVNFDGLVEEIKNFNIDKYNLLLKGIDENIYDKNLFNIISEERVMKKMLEVFSNK